MIKASLKFVPESKFNQDNSDLKLCFKCEILPTPIYTSIRRVFYHCPKCGDAGESMYIQTIPRNLPDYLEKLTSALKDSKFVAGILWDIRQKQKRGEMET